MNLPCLALDEQQANRLDVLQHVMVEMDERSKHSLILGNGECTAQGAADGLNSNEVEIKKEIYDLRWQEGRFIFCLRGQKAEDAGQKAKRLDREMIQCLGPHQFKAFPKKPLSNDTVNTFIPFLEFFWKNSQHMRNLKRLGFYSLLSPGQAIHPHDFTTHQHYQP